MITLTILMMLQAAGVISLPFLTRMGITSGKTATNSYEKEQSKSIWNKIANWFLGALSGKGHGSLGEIPMEQMEANDDLMNIDTSFLDGTSKPSSYPDVWNPYEGTSRGEAPPGWLDSGNSAALGVPTQTSAQGNVTTVPDAGSVAGHIEDTENGGSGQGVSNTEDWLKQIMATLGITSLFGNDNESGHSWLSYQDIVNDERLYGEGAIADARRWQEYMAGTAYQRTVKDIKAAGLNPWLAVQSGSLSPASWGAVDTGSALGNISTSLGQSLSNSNSNSSSAIIVALIMMLAKVMMS